MHHPSTYVCTEVVDFKISLFPYFVCINHIHSYVGSDLDYPLPLFSPLNIINFLCFLWMCLSSRASFPFCFPHCSHCVTFCNWHEVWRSYLHSAPIMKHCQIQAPEKYLPHAFPHHMIVISHSHLYYYLWKIVKYTKKCFSPSNPTSHNYTLWKIHFTPYFATCQREIAWTAKKFFKLTSFFFCN